MEENRLKPMVEGYDPLLFEDLYNQTKALRRKLASQIDSARFGVDTSEILSWFDVKFIYIFNKYYKKYADKPEVLKGHLIKGMQFFKCRILRMAYSQKALSQLKTIELSDYEEFEFVQIEEPEIHSNKDYLYNLAIDYMKKNLSENAFELLNIQLNPPPYILNKLFEEGVDNTNKIPNSIIADYFELGTDEKALKYINALKREIKVITQKAGDFFNSAPRYKLGPAPAILQ